MEEIENMWDKVFATDAADSLVVCNEVYSMSQAGQDTELTRINGERYPGLKDDLLGAYLIDPEQFVKLRAIARQCALNGLTRRTIAGAKRRAAQAAETRKQFARSKNIVEWEQGEL